MAGYLMTFFVEKLKIPQGKVSIFIYKYLIIKKIF
jgi:hypothetical protein